ncbi:MAG: hypothetical protein AAGH15_05955, partial [Myxococcota bacterium]
MKTPPWVRRLPNRARSDGRGRLLVRGRSDGPWVIIDPPHEVSSYYPTRACVFVSWVPATDPATGRERP